ncbi:MAG: transcription termination factor Rho [Puniceicoccales bacterium]|jgi:transcription termination factor Rho|nr:transcription termination factor Rho [Puniceicoccales bacterium]
MEICGDSGMLGQRVNFVGIFEIVENEHRGRLVRCDANGIEDPADPYVGMDIIRRYRLRRGQKISATALLRTNFPNAKVLSVEKIDGMPPEERHRCIPFERLVPVQPRRRMVLECEDCYLHSRVIDLFCPIGKGQRAIIASPPRAGKTLLLHEIAKSIGKNFPEVATVVALIDERPEEVTDFKRSVDAEIYASSNDQGLRHHTRIARLAGERAKNLAESGRDVVLFIDSLTRLVRAHNAAAGSGRTMTGGIDSSAMEIPKKMFALARDTDGGGSLTVIATALVETGSRMDDLIFQELRGTGNLEIVLSSKLAEMRLWPAIDLRASGARHEDLLLPARVLEVVSFLRRAFAGMEPEKAMELLLGRLGQYASNGEFLAAIAKSGR